MTEAGRSKEAIISPGEDKQRKGTQSQRCRCEAAAELKGRESPLTSEPSHLPSSGLVRVVELDGELHHLLDDKLLLDHLELVRHPILLGDGHVVVGLEQGE